MDSPYRYSVHDPHQRCLPRIYSAPPTNFTDSAPYVDPRQRCQPVTGIVLPIDQRYQYLSPQPSNLTYRDCHHSCDHNYRQFLENRTQRQVLSPQHPVDHPNVFRTLYLVQAVPDRSINLIFTSLAHGFTTYSSRNWVHFVTSSPNTSDGVVIHYWVTRNWLGVQAVMLVLKPSALFESDGMIWYQNPMVAAVCVCRTTNSCH